MLSSDRFCCFLVKCCSSSVLPPFVEIRQIFHLTEISSLLAARSMVVNLYLNLLEGTLYMKLLPNSHFNWDFRPSQTINEPTKLIINLRKTCGNWSVNTLRRLHFFNWLKCFNNLTIYLTTAHWETFVRANVLTFYILVRSITTNSPLSTVSKHARHRVRVKLLR